MGKPTGPSGGHGLVSEMGCGQWKRQMQISFGGLNGLDLLMRGMYRRGRAINVSLVSEKMKVELLAKMELVGQDGMRGKFEMSAGWA